jgi:hypothetical protein
MTVGVARTAALVLETNNLRGGREPRRAEASLERAVALLAQQTVPLSTLAQFIITHDGLSRECRHEIERIAGRPVTFVGIDPSVGYYEAKNAGFAATDASGCTHVVFADSDCVPEPDWLENLLRACEAEDAPDVVAGRTSYAPTVFGTALTTIDFMYFPSPLGAQATRNFYANNVVFRREVFDRWRYQALDGVYRAHCQVLGLKLQEAGVRVRYVSEAHTRHKLPDSLGEVIKLRWMRGEDTCGLTPHLVRAYLSDGWQWLGRSGPLGPLLVLLSRLGYSLHALNHQDLPRLKGLRWLGAVLALVAVSGVDMAGAMVRGLGWKRARSGETEALSYHRR